jgi:hypothetical protein
VKLNDDGEFDGAAESGWLGATITLGALDGSTVRELGGELLGELDGAVRLGGRKMLGTPDGEKLGTLDGTGEPAVGLGGMMFKLGRSEGWADRLGGILGAID